MYVCVEFQFCNCIECCLRFAVHFAQEFVVRVQGVIIHIVYVCMCMGLDIYSVCMYVCMCICDMI